MSILDRFLLFVLSVVGLVIGILLALSGANVLPLQDVGLLSYSSVRFVVIAIGVLTLLISLRFMFYRVARGQALDYVTMTGDHGPIRISHDTLVQLANRRGSQIKGAQGFDTRVRQSQEGVVVLVRMQVFPDVDISLLSREVQVSVKEYLEQTTSIHVERVSVHVTELSSAGRQGKAWNDV